MAKFTVLLSVVMFLTYGCTAIHPIKLSTEELGLLKQEKEIRAVHYKPFDILTSPLGPSISIKDPLIRVKREFLKTIKNKLNLSNIRVIDGHRFGYSSIYMGASLKPLKRTFIEGLVFDFGSVDWNLRMYPGFSLDFRKRSHSLRYSVHVRLVRVENLQIIWQGTCNIGKNSLGISKYPVYVEPKEKRQTGSELTENNNTILKAKGLEAADICVKQLVAQFFGGKGKDDL